MAVRPKTRPSNGFNHPKEDLACGYIMHQYKGIRCKMRWGQLWTGEGENGQNRCDIRLFKYDIINPKPGTFTKNDLKLKMSFEFTEGDFCGLEKGEHYTKNGKRRYICIILKEKHLIVQDAITALTDTDHNVIGTWYERITSTMHYANRWKIFNFGNASLDTKYFHVSKENACVCCSLHNSNVAQKGKKLLDQLFKTKAIVNVDEIREVYDGSSCSRVIFYEVNHGMDVKQSFVVHGTMKLSEVLSRLGQDRQTTTLCPGFDDLMSGNPNLVKLPPEEGKKNPSPMSLKQLSSTDRAEKTNNYILQDPDSRQSSVGESGFVSPGPSFDQRPPIPARNSRSNTLGQSLDLFQTRGLGQPDRIDPSTFSPTNPFASGPSHHDVNGRNRQQPPDYLNKKSQELASLTQRSSDSDYHTGEMSALQLTSNNTNQTHSEIASNLHESINGHYININNDPVVNVQASNPSMDIGVVPAAEDIAILPPAIPPRDTSSNVQTQSDDLIQSAIRQQNLPPIDTDPESRRPGYENSLNIEMAIADCLDRNDVDLTNLGLPYSVYMSLILGLEKDSVANGSWRGLASALCMSFRDVELIESAVKNHPQLLPAQVVLLHWQRTQAPYKLTRSALKNILSEIMKRLDLAALIPIEEKEDTETNDDKQENNSNHT